MLAAAVGALLLLAPAGEIKEAAQETRTTRAARWRHEESDRRGRRPLRSGLPDKSPAALSALPFPQLPQAPSTSFTSVTQSQAGDAQPPDVAGAVGPTQFLTHVSGRVRVHAKTNGAIGALDATDSAFWSSVRTPGAGNYVFNPRVRYDRLTDRWFVLVVDVPLNVGSAAGVSNRVLIAVSDGPTIGAATVWRYFYFDQAQAAPASDAGCLADYPTLGLDGSALYVGADIYCGPDIDSLDFFNSTAFVLRKSDLLNAATPANLASTPGALTAFRHLIDGGSGIGMLTPTGADRPEATASSGHFIGVDNAAFGRLVLRVVSNPGSGAPTLGPDVLVNVPATTLPAPVDIAGGRTLDGFDDRLMSAEVRGGRLWTVHQIEVNASGVATTGGGRNGLRWYAIDLATAAAVESGTVFDGAGANPNSYWTGSLGVSGQGHVALGSSVASPLTYPGAATVGRLASDPPGTTQDPPVVYQPPQGTYDPAVAGDRWGDYSTTSLDPCDDMSLWTIQEFAAPGGVNDTWGTQAVRLLAPPPGTPSSATSVLPQGQAALPVTLTGSGWYDPPSTGMSSCRVPLSVGVTGGVTVTSVTFVSPTRVDLVLDTTAASVGSQSVTLTNPDGQQASASIFTVASVPVVTATKTVAGTFAPGGPVTYTLVLTNTGTAVQGDNPGDELVDVLPAELTLVSASATSGTATAVVATNTVTWNGALASGATVTVTIQATVGAATPGASIISNQGTVHYDADGNGVNEATRPTDDPALPGPADPTSFSTSAFFYPVDPCRLVDTRGPAGPSGAPALVPGSRSFVLAGSCGVPADARTVSINVTVTSPTHVGDLRLYPAGSPLPLVSTINYSAGQTRANNAIAVLSATGSLAVQCDQAAGSVDLIIDVNGYFR